jgi:predicted Zn-dependent peptidase
MKLTRYREFESFSPQPGVRLLAYHTERFKTVHVRAYLLEPIAAVRATENALLVRVLRTGTESWPTRRAIARRGEELYGAELRVGVTRYADAQAVAANIDFPADRYLPKGAKELEHAFDLLLEALTRPALNQDGSAFRAETVEHEKYQLGLDLRALRDDRPGWAALQSARRVYAGTPAAIYEHGNESELEPITPQALLARHRSLIRNARVLIFVTGPVQPLHALRVLAQRLDLPRGRRVKIPPPVSLRDRHEPRRFRESNGGGQTQLVFTWSGGGVYGTEDYAPTLFADALLGGYGMNRLFKVVREEHGLAYSIGTAYHRARGSIVGQAAVAPEQATRAAKLIRQEFRRLREGGFTDEEFEGVRESLGADLRATWDSQASRIVDAAFQNVLGFSQTLERQLRDIRNTTPRQVQVMLRNLKPHTEFRLG